MLTRVTSRLAVSDAARQRILSELSTPERRADMAALLFGQDVSTKSTAWSVAYYDQAVVHGPDFDALVFEAGGIDWVLPQVTLKDFLDDAELDWNGVTFVLKPPPPIAGRD